MTVRSFDFLMPETIIAMLAASEKSVIIILIAVFPLSSKNSAVVALTAHSRAVNDEKTINAVFSGCPLKLFLPRITPTAIITADANGAIPGN